MDTEIKVEPESNSLFVCTNLAYKADFDSDITLSITLHLSAGNSYSLIKGTDHIYLPYQFKGPIFYKFSDLY